MFAVNHRKFVMSLRRLWTFIAVMIALVVVPSFAQDDTLLFEATFDDGLIPESLNIQYGRYEAVDGSLSYTVNNGGFLVIPDGVAWTDYAIETRLNITTGSVWLQARTGGDLCSGYYLTINPSADLYDLSVSDRDCNFTVLEVIESADISADWLVARIEVQGDQIRTYINDELLLSATNSQYSIGYPIINVFPAEDDEAQVQFDTIRIIDLSLSEAVDETPSAGVTPEPESVELPTIDEIPLNDDPQRIIETLQELGLIPTGEGQLYTGNAVSISRIGTWFDPLFEDAVGDNVVMSGTIDFLPYSETESCLLSARIIRDEVGVAQQYLDVGFNARHEVFIGESVDNGDYSQATQDGFLTESKGNVLFIAYRNRLSVYVDGQAVFQNIEVTQREGSFGVSAIESTSYSVCHVTDIWAYTFEG
jgi:hypothetical protein